MKEKYELIEEQITDNAKEYNWCDIINLIEFSYIFKGKKEIEKLEDIIKKYSMDGINTWGIFVKFCYDKFLTEEFMDLSLEDFAKYELANCVEEFINKYFEDDKKEVYVVYQYGYDGSELMEILGVYKDIMSAEKKYYQEITENIADFDFDYDKECKDVVTNAGRMSRLFKGGYQENWDNYLEIHIEVQEVK